jgi:hypothetical protein
MAGTAAMVMAFVIVLSLYIRKGDIRFLPYTGGLLFLIRRLQHLLRMEEDAEGDGGCGRQARDDPDGEHLSARLPGNPLLYALPEPFRLRGSIVREAFPQTVFPLVIHCPSI